MENAAAFPTIQPLDYDYEKQDTTACPIWLEKNVSTNLDKIIISLKVWSSMPFIRVLHAIQPVA